MEIKPVGGARGARLTTEMSEAERRKGLWSAYERYMRGEIDVEELVKIASPYTPSLFTGVTRSSSRLSDNA